MDAGFDKDEAEFRVLVFTVALEMLADGNSLSSRQRQSPSLGKKRGKKCGRSEVDATFLINMYRSSGISGARPVHVEITPSVIDQAEAMP